MARAFRKSHSGAEVLSPLGPPALCSSVESSVSDSCRKGSTDEYLVIYYD